MIRRSLSSRKAKPIETRKIEAQSTSTQPHDAGDVRSRSSPPAEIVAEQGRCPWWLSRFIDILDYKTGKHLDASLFAPVISRFVLKRLINTHLPDESFAPVIFTELYLAKRHVRTTEMTMERCLADLEELKRTLVGIATETTWAPIPSPLCEWCPFNGNGCEPMVEEQSIGLW